jgi:UDP-N-acetylmuramoylalanine-D-glutamate ligase
MTSNCVSHLKRYFLSFHEYALEKKKIRKHKKFRVESEKKGNKCLKEIMKKNIKCFLTENAVCESVQVTQISLTCDSRNAFYL